MANDEARKNDEARMTNESASSLRHSIIWASFVIRHLGFVIFSLLASLRRGRLEFLEENVMAVGRHRRSLRLSAFADT